MVEVTGSNPVWPTTQQEARTNVRAFFVTARRKFICVRDGTKKRP